MRKIISATGAILLAATNVWAYDEMDCPSNSPNGATCWTCGSHCTAVYSNGKLTIDGEGSMKNYSYTSSPLLTTAPWKEIASDITSVEVKGMSSTGNSAFLGLNQVNNVQIGNSVEKIGNFSFDNMHGLHSVEIPDSVQILGADSFHGTPLTSVTFGPNSNLTTLEGSAFEGVYFSKFVLPPLVNKIGSVNTFRNTPASNIYCTGHQIETGVCSTQSQHYELDDGMYIVYNSDGSINSIYESNVALLQGRVADSYTKKDINGNPVAVYDGQGNIQQSYIYNDDGSVKIFNAHGKLIGLQGKRILTVEEASALVKNNKNTFKLKYR